MLITFTSGTVKPNFILNGKISVKQSGKIVVSYFTSSKKVIIDTVDIKNGCFRFAANVDNTIPVYIKYLNWCIRLEPTKSNYSIEINPNQCTLSASKPLLDQIEYDKLSKSLVKELDVIGEQQRKVLRLYENCKDSVKEVALNHENVSLCDKIDSIYTYKFNPFEEQFIRTHPNSFVSADLLSDFIRREGISFEKCKELYNILGATVKKGLKAREIKDDIRKIENTTIGSIAPDFEANDIMRDKMIRLSDFRGKVVYLDFWMNFYFPYPYSYSIDPNKHKLGLEVITVNKNVEKDMKDWNWTDSRARNADLHHVRVAENLFEWKITNKDIYANYYLYPTSRRILIDKKGVIRGNWSGYSNVTAKEIRDLIDKLIAE